MGIHERTPSKMKLFRLIIVILCVLFLCFIVKKIFIPFLPQLTPGKIVDLGVKDLLKICELSAIFILMAAFVLEEIIHLTKSLLEPTVLGDQGSLWQSMVFLFTLIFGSFWLYYLFLQATGL
jgi:hypothetical protein